MRHFTATHCILLPLLVQLIFLIATKAERSAYDNIARNIPTESNRLIKSSPTDEFPEILEAMIIDENGDFFHLKWKKADQYLANEHLPVWIVTSDKKYQQISDVFESIGDFAVYQDLELSSAVLYIQNKNAIWGNIDTAYYIHALPVRSLSECHRAGGKHIRLTNVFQHREPRRPKPSEYIKKFFRNCHSNDTFVEYEEDIDVNLKVWILNFLSFPDDKTLDRKNVTRSSVSTTNQVRKREINMESYNSNIRTRQNSSTTSQYYIEILLLLSFDMIEDIKNSSPNFYIANVVMSFICYFNSIDMLMAKIPTDDFNVHVNLAGMIIEDDKNVFSSMMNIEDLAYSHYQRTIISGKILDKFRAYVSPISDFPFEKDSFDAIFVPTSHYINDNITAGITHGYVNGVYGMRKNHSYDVPTAFVQFYSPLMNIAEATHEMAHIIRHIKHDPVDSGQFFDGKQCYAIMQVEGPLCFHCLVWSKESLVEFTKFFSKHPDRCFLSNFPRSLRPKGPQLYDHLSPDLQCQCYGYDSSYEEGLDADSMCNNPLKCMKNGMPEYTILPLDGTPCDTNEMKVCWQQACVKINQYGIPTNDE